MVSEPIIHSLFARDAAARSLGRVDSPRTFHRGERETAIGTGRRKKKLAILSTGENRFDIEIIERTRVIKFVNPSSSLRATRSFAFVAQYTRLAFSFIQISHCSQCNLETIGTIFTAILVYTELQQCSIALPNDCHSSNSLSTIKETKLF